MKLFSTVGVSVAVLFLAGGAVEKTTMPVDFVQPAQPAAVLDTLVCPELDTIRAYLQSGFGNDTTSCSLVSWTHDVTQSVLLGPSEAYYQEWADVDETAPTSVDVYEVEIDSLRLYAVRNPVIDEHFLEPDIVGDSNALHIGLQRSVAYDLWDDSTTKT